MQILASIQPRTSPVKFARSSGAAKASDGDAELARELARRDQFLEEKENWIARLQGAVRFFGACGEEVLVSVLNGRLTDAQDVHHILRRSKLKRHFAKRFY